MTEPLHVVAAVIHDGERVLACRRREGIASAGAWEFPGGKVEPGEQPADALVREIREELGVTIEVIGELTTDDTAVDGRVIRLRCLRARLIDGRPVASTDHDVLAWVTREELSGLAWAKPDLPAVARLMGGEA